jgi:serine/threonine protein kinase/uncharacterized protein YjdB
MEAQRLGSRYELFEVLGAGGMGTVHRGIRSDTQVPVAIKVLKPEYSADRGIVARFVQERDALCGITHPNIVSVRDLVVEGDTLAIVMDLVVGDDLRHVLISRGGTLSPSEAFELAAQVLEALEVVHRHGVCHRDVKPENVLIPTGTPLVARLSDFGIAKVVDERGISTTQSSLIGTPYYMSPELGEGDPATPACDLYSVGCMLYELLAGSPPFTGSPLTVLRRHSDELPTPIPGVHPAAWEQIARLLAKAPAQRPASAAIAAADLRRIAPLMAGVAPLPQFRGGKGERVPESPVPHSRSNTILPPPQATEIRKRPEGFAAPIPVPAPPAAADSKKTGTGSTRKRGWYIATGVALLPLIAAVAVFAIKHNSSSSAAAAQKIEFSATPVVYDSGLLAGRTWTVADGSSPTVTSTLTITNSKDAPVSGDIEEVIPKSLAASVDNITFIPAPATVIQKDPVVQYHVTDLGAHKSVVFRYKVNVTHSTDWNTQLSTWNDERTAEVAQRPAAATLSLAGLTVSPDTLALIPGGTATIAATGKMTDESVASADVMGAVSYQSSDPTVATVDGTTTPATVHALKGGTVTITVQAGKLTATVAVTVTDAGTSVAATATQTTPAAAPPPGTTKTTTKTTTGATTAQTPAPTPKATTAATPSPTPAHTPPPTPQPTPSPTPAPTNPPPQPSVSISWDSVAVGASPYVITVISNFPANASVTLQCHENTSFVYPAFTVSTQSGNTTYRKTSGNAVCFNQHGLITWVTATVNGAVYTSNQLT